MNRLANRWAGFLSFRGTHVQLAVYLAAFFELDSSTPDISLNPARGQEFDSTLG